MNLCASSQWKMVYWLVLCCKKVGACILSYGWPCFQKTSDQFDRICLQGFMFHTGREKFFMQSKDTQMKLVILLLEHNELCSV